MSLYVIFYQFQILKTRRREEIVFSSCQKLQKQIFTVSESKPLKQRFRL
ncbi:hypothetical protein B4144_0700 [Bacillus atrophaeus]|nr:hypothetical protein B4144_0700 [Bacillus atrophaeus]